MRHLPRTRLAVVAASVAALLAACGGNDAGTTALTADPATTTAGTTGASAAFNDADVMFAQSMIPHHQQAVAMASLALDPARNAGLDVISLAERIQSAQEPEIEQMRRWLEQWGAPEMDTSGGHDMRSMDGMMSDAEMERLASLTGPEFDTAWMEAMIAHHEGAIAMAEDVKANGASTDVTTLAEAIIAGQQAEIDEMRALLVG